MPKRTSEAYESDGGFVEDAPNSKKSRKANDIKRREGKQEVELEMQQDGNGDAYWELSKMRRVTLSNFKGKEMINIREYYNGADGKELPGKKGISLPIDQYAALIAVLPQIEAQLAKSGVDIPRPRYERDKPEADVDVDGDDADEPANGKLRKSNIEETSDEGEA